MEKDLENQIEEVKSEEVANEETVTAEEFEAAEAKENGKKAKKEKKPMTKKKKIIIGVVSGVVAAILLAIIITVVVLFTMGGAVVPVDDSNLMVYMDNNYYVAKGEIDLSKAFPNGKDFTAKGATITDNILKVNSDAAFELSFTDIVVEDEQEVEKAVTKNVTVVADAVNVASWEDIKAQTVAGKKVVLQNAFIKVGDLTGQKREGQSIVLKNDFYGNGHKLNVFNLVASRKATKDDTFGEIVPAGNGKAFGEDAFIIAPLENNKKVVLRDLHITGNDMDLEGDLAGLDQEQVDARGLKLYSGYGALVYAYGKSDETKQEKANAQILHCVIENGHKVVHLQDANIDMEGCIVRNASDTAVSVGTFANKKVTLNSKNNVIANSLTGGILFYCYDGGITAQNEAKTWNELNIEGFLDIYNWKPQDGLAFLPETEGAYADLANMLTGSVIQDSQYEKLKADVDGDKYIHFAIIKIRTGNGAITQNKSVVNGADELGYNTSRGLGYEKGFPIPEIAAGIMKDIDVWGYYAKKDGAVAPTAKIGDNANIYMELLYGRK